jgi:uncharacterized metal-binding protein YceD (DUF177 family)
LPFGLQKVSLLFKQRNASKAKTRGFDTMTSPTEPVFQPIPLSHPLRVAGLSSRKPNRFDLRPDPKTRAALAEYLGITDVLALRFHGMISPMGKRDFVLEAELSARVEQPCSVSLAPVVTELSDKVHVRYLAEMAYPDAEEAEMPEDDSSEPLGDVIDAGHVAVEALALSLPLYPRADGAELQEASFTAPGLAPIRDEDLRPFAGLAALKEKLAAAQASPAKDATSPAATEGGKAESDKPS